MQTSSQSVCCTWKPTTAGVLSIIAGALNVIAGVVVMAFGRFGHMWGGMWDGWYGMWDGGWSMMGFAGFAAVGGLLIALGIVSIIGGIFALKRRVWGMALAGGITALFPPPLIVLGILTIVFVAISKGEFDQPRQTPPPATTSPTPPPATPGQPT